MLHILWLILKFILTIIGVILGFIFLMLLLILFCPIGYEAFGSKETENWKEASGGGGVSWLFHLISVKVWYQNGKLEKSIVLFGIPLLKVLDWLKNRKKKKEVLSDENTESEIPELPDLEEHSQGDISETDFHEIDQVNKNDVQAEQQSDESLKKPEAIKSVSEENSDHTEKRRVKKEKKKKIEEKKASEKSSGEKKKDNAPKVPLSEKVNHLIAKIKTAIENAEETKARIQAKISEWTDFLGHEKTKAAIRLVLRTLKRIIKHVLPNSMSGDVTFGSDNPSLMGNVLIATSMTIPLHKNAVRLNPVFNEGNIVQGHIKLKGRIIVIVFVANAVRVICSRNIWFVIKHFRKKQEG